MNKNNMFNQKLEQIGGENIVDGITLKIEDKEKILNFINANTNQNYILNDNKLEKEKNEQEIKNTLLDEEIDCAIKENRKILIALSENVENVIEMYISEDNTERLILIDKDFCEKDNLEDLRKTVYEEVKEIHMKRFPYNNFLFQYYDEEENDSEE